MPRYLVERNFADGLFIPIDREGASAVEGVIERNLGKDVTWVHSYVTPDKKKSFCVYDAPAPEAIRTAAAQNGVPADAISEVRVLDPYFYY